MSYCRWSTDDFGCDLYVYMSGDDRYTIHVAGNRVVGDIPKITVELFPDTVKEFLVQHDAQMEWLKTAERKPIGLEHDGKTFDLSGEGTIAKLRELKRLGYKFPDYVIDDIANEGADDD